MKKLKDLRMVKLIFSVIFIINCLPMFAQDATVGIIKSDVNFREEPSVESHSYGILRKGFQVEILDYRFDPWIHILVNTVNKGKETELIGYVKSDYLEDYSKYPKIEGLTTSEERVEIGCDNITPIYDRKYGNTLRINAQNTSDDTVLKIYKLSTNECIRMIYVRGNSSFAVNDIPSGTYYFKTASGKDMRKKVDEDGNCIIVFAKNHRYEKTSRTFTFSNNGVNFTDGEYIIKPASHRKNAENVRTKQISEEEFNR